MIGPMSDPDTTPPTAPVPPGARRTRTAGTATPPAAAKPKKPATRKRRPPDRAKAWVRSLGRSRRDLVPFVLDGLASAYGHPTWQRVHDPTSELVLTILSQNSADVNAEQAFEALRRAYPGRSSDMPLDALPVDTSPEGPRSDLRTSDDRPREAAADTRPDPAGTVPKINRPGWGGAGLDDATPPDWDAVERAPIDELTNVIRSGGLANQKAPRIQAALRTIRDQTGSHSLEFLGDRSALDARDWLTAIDGIGRKTASVVLLFSFGTPLMPVDRHVERVSHRIGLIPPKASADDAHELYLAMLEPDQVYEAHVNLIVHGRRTCHARKPVCDACPVAPRCRFIDRRAP
jgi:endonuclease III